MKKSQYLLGIVVTVMTLAAIILITACDSLPMTEAELTQQPTEESQAMPSQTLQSAEAITDKALPTEKATLATVPPTPLRTEEPLEKVSATELVSTPAQIFVSSEPTPTATPDVYYSDAVVVPGATYTPSSAPPLPTVVPIAQSEYQLTEIARLPNNRNGQYLNLTGWLSDNQLFVYGLANPASDAENKATTQETFVMALPVDQNIVVSEDLPVTQLDASLTYWSVDSLSEPIKLSNAKGSFIYRKEIDDGQFELWLSSLDGSQQQRQVTQMDTPAFAVSEDGLLAYVNNDQVFIVNPTMTQNVHLTDVSLEDYDLDTGTRYFDLALASGGEHLAMYDYDGHFYIVDLKNNIKHNLSVPETVQVIDAVWSPDGKMLAYTVGPHTDQIVIGGAGLRLQDADVANDPIRAGYSGSSGYEPVSFVKPSWSPDGKIVSAITDPYQCNDDCRDVLIFLSSDGKTLTEVEKQRTFYTLKWSPNGNYVAYYCFKGDGQPGNICISEITRE